MVFLGQRLRLGRGILIFAILSLALAANETDSEPNCTDCCKEHSYDNYMKPGDFLSWPLIWIGWFTSKAFEAILMNQYFFYGACIAMLSRHYTNAFPEVGGPAIKLTLLLGKMSKHIIIVHLWHNTKWAPHVPFNPFVNSCFLVFLDQLLFWWISQAMKESKWARKLRLANLKEGVKNVAFRAQRSFGVDAGTQQDVEGGGREQLLPKEPTPISNWGCVLLALFFFVVCAGIYASTSGYWQGKWLLALCAFVACIVLCMQAKIEDVPENDQNEKDDEKPPELMARNVYEDLTRQFKKCILFFGCQLCLLMYYIYELWGLNIEEEWEDNIYLHMRDPNCFSMTKWILAVVLCEIAHEDDVGAKWSRETFLFWETLRKKCRESNTGKARILGFQMPAIYHINARFLMDYAINATMFAGIMVSVPIMLAVEQPLDYVKDVTAIFFIMKLDDIDDAVDLQKEESWEKYRKRLGRSNPAGSGGKKESECGFLNFLDVEYKAGLDHGDLVPDEDDAGERPRVQESRNQERSRAANRAKSFHST